MPPPVKACAQTAYLRRQYSPPPRSPLPIIKPRTTRSVSPIQLLSKAILRKNTRPKTTARMPTRASQLPPRSHSQSIARRRPLKPPGPPAAAAEAAG